MDSILNSADSLSILDLIDSVLLATEPLGSQLAVRVGYNNNIVGNGSSSVRQFGLNAGASYYHKTGAYLDVSGYYTNQYEPAYYLTIGAIGYLTSIKKYWSLLVEYDHYFYTPVKGDEDVYTPYTNNIYLSNYFKVKKFVFRFDYNFYFGELLSHRLAPSVGLNLTKKKWLGVDRISFLPTVGLWYGSETIQEYVPNYTTRLQRAMLLAQRKPLFSLKDRTVWGIMNYVVSIPVSVMYKDWSLMASYNLNFQKGLPGEGVETYRTGYAGLSITRYFDL
ncbi:MAG TPA: hypothetical protein VFE50_16120 [Cyclobacteriaceae bacterium]|nr:hypothetical protein [Cyclobacteriaceae bacterium]